MVCKGGGQLPRLPPAGYATGYSSANVIYYVTLCASFPVLTVQSCKSHSRHICVTFTYLCNGVKGLCDLTFYLLIYLCYLCLHPVIVYICVRCANVCQTKLQKILY